MIGNQKRDQQYSGLVLRMKYIIKQQGQKNDEIWKEYAKKSK
jgi:hypothetical protein